MQTIYPIAEVFFKLNRSDNFTATILTMACINASMYKLFTAFGYRYGRGSRYRRLEGNRPLSEMNLKGT